MLYADLFCQIGYYYGKRAAAAAISGGEEIEI
jgi:hypothetical protein